MRGDRVGMTAMALLVGVVFGPLTAAHAAESESHPLAEPVDKSELRITWRNLANEQVMHPFDMIDMPVKIGAERQLFLDNYLIAEARDVTRQVHQPERHGSPVLTPEMKPEHKSQLREGVFTDIAYAQHVKQFDTSPRFRMWYWSWFPYEFHTLPNGQKVRYATSYATSEDGVNWQKPELNLYQIEEMSDDNNVVLPYGLIHGVFYEPEEPDPQKRFKALVCVDGQNPEIREGYYLHTSPDGIHWTADLSHFVIPSQNLGGGLQSIQGYPATGNGLFGLHQGGLSRYISDTSWFWWDPIRKKYMGDVKFSLLEEARCRGMMESDDLLHWTRPRPTFFARTENTQIYGHTSFPYQAMYVGMRWIFSPDYDSGLHAVHIELDCSRNGHDWTRVGVGQPFMALNPRHDTWDNTKVQPVAMLEVGEEIWIYYIGGASRNDLKRPNFPEAQRVPMSTGLAKLKRDRFVSINAGDQTGMLLTRPIDFTGQTLHLNADVAAGGQLSVAVIDRDGKAIPGYEAESCKALEGDGVDMPVKWAQASKLDGPAGATVRLRFRLKNAKLYSFWID